MGDQMTFQGVGYIESQDREDEHRTGVPSLGGAVALLDAPARRTSKVVAVNAGEADVHARLKHQGATKTQTNEYLTALAAGGNKYIGQLQYRSLVAGSVSITNAGAPPTVVDDGTGRLYDTGFVGVAANLRGTINYTLGTFSLQYGAAPTEPVRITYQHTDYSDFLSPSQTTTKPAAVFPFTINLGFGRVNPGSVAIVDGNPLAFVDDGKGSIIETTGGGAVKRGTIDYARGIITLTAASLALAGTVSVTYTFNPFAALIVHAGGSKGLELFPGQIPELSAAAWAVGLKSDGTVGLHGETMTAGAHSNLVTRWSHYSEDSYRVRELYSGFPPGGHTNDPRLAGQTPFSS
jgi:hypothetical protein